MVLADDVLLFVIIKTILFAFVPVIYISGLCLSDVSLLNLLHTLIQIECTLVFHQVQLESTVIRRQ